jgi:hypothetical protein
MNKKNKRSMVILFVVVAAFLLLFGGLAPGEVTPDGVMNGSQWTGGNGLTWLSVLFAIGLCVLLDRMLFSKKSNPLAMRKSVIQKTNMEDRYERQRKGTHRT